MSILDLSTSYLTKIEIEGSRLLAYYVSVEEPQSFDLAGITGLDCSSNCLTSLPNNLPENFVFLDCYDNFLVELPPLPKSLKELSCPKNTLATLPELPAGLTSLICYNNGLTSLPKGLPENLIILECSNNNLKELPDPLPPRLEELLFHGNEVTSLPDFLPASLTTFWCYDNPLKYIPFWKTRPKGLVVSLKDQHRYSVKNYREGYRRQKITRYLFLTFFATEGLQLDFLDLP